MFAEIQIIHSTAQHFCINKIITQILFVLYDKYRKKKYCIHIHLFYLYIVLHVCDKIQTNLEQTINSYIM